MTTSATEVRFGRLDRRGLLLGLSAVQLGLVGAALVVLVAAGLADGPVGIATSAPIWLAVVAVALVPIGGRPMVEAIPVAVPWLARRAYRRNTLIAAPAHPDVLRIPGVPGRLRVRTDRGSGVGVVEAVRRGTGRAPFVVIARVTGRGFLLAEAAEQDRQVDGWGRLLASLSQLGHVSGVQVLHRTATGERGEVQRWWAAQTRTGSAWAQAVVADLLADTAQCSTLETMLALSVRPRRGLTASTVIASVTESLESAGVELTGWLTPSQIRGGIRAAYDPAWSGTETTGHPGPMGLAEAWSHARSDSGCHATFWVSDWPRSATHPSFLRPLLLAPGATRTFSLTAQPLPPGKALREIRRARAEQVADATGRARIGQVTDEATRAAAAELTRREQDLIAGHGDLRFTGLITVTAATLDELEDACASLASAAAQAGCELRRLVGQQVQAFAAAALPLARVLS